LPEATGAAFDIDPLDIVPLLFFFAFDVVIWPVPLLIDPVDFDPLDICPLDICPLDIDPPDICPLADCGLDMVPLDMVPDAFGLEPAVDCAKLVPTRAAQSIKAAPAAMV
jgi:hypothetical protein